MISRVLGKDLAIKLAAVLLAVVVWLTVFNEKNPLERKTVSLEVQYVGLSSDKVVMSVFPREISCTLAGRSRTLATADLGQVKALVDLSKATVGRNVAAVTVADVPYGVHVLEVGTSSVTVEIDTLVSKEVNVTVMVRGTPNEDYDDGIPSSSPTTALVRGPKRYVDRVQWAVADIDIGGAYETVTSKVPITARDADGNEITGVVLEPSEVQVTVPLIPLPPSKTVPVQVDISGTPKPGYRINRTVVTPDHIKLRADASVLRNIQVLVTRPVDVSGRDTSFTYEAAISVPAGLSWIQATRVSVRVEIVEDIAEKTLVAIPVQPPMTLPPGLTWDIEPPKVDVVLRGRSDMLAGVTSSSVEAYLDVTGLGEGTYELSVSIRAPAGVVVKEVNPEKVTLILRKR